MKQHRTTPNKKRYLTALGFALLLLLGQPIFGQAVRYEIKGRITDGVTGKPLSGVSVTLRQLKVGTRTDSSGRYVLKLLPGQYTLFYSFVGYNARTYYLSLTGNQVVDLTLNQDMRELQEITVTDRAPDANVSATQMGVVRLDIKNLKSIPVVFGETDILKALLLQPGVTTVGEGAGGFNVRGGRTDQNLVLLDGAPIFNTSHLLGMLSNINADAIQDVTLYKGNIPASYGGRLSSLLILNTKSGQSDRVSITGGIGLLTSRLMAQGPLTRDRKLTFVAGGRIAYPNFILRLFPSPTKSDRAFFYDLNGRITYRPNPGSQVTATIYHSYDTFKFPQDTLYGWQTTLGTLHYSQRLGTKTSLNLTATQSGYRLFLNGLTTGNQYQFQSTIRQRDARLDFLWTPAQHRLEVGTAFTAYRLEPGSINPTDNTNVNSMMLPAENAREWAAYVSDEWTPLKWLSVQAGARFVQFFNVGPGVAYQYAANQSRSPETITDTLTYLAGQTLARYGGWEPRLMLRVNLSALSSVKVSYNRTRQYLHLISNTTALSPVDFWKSSDPLIPPQLADQWSIGYFRNFQENTYELAIELYDKKLTNLVEYKNGATLLLNPTIDADLLQAEGRAYGIETSIQKKQGRLTGMAAYTYSRSFARVNSPYALEQINRGNWYPSTFDRPHNVAISTLWKWSKGWTFGTNFVYMSGRPTTYPDGTYRLNTAVVFDYSQRNADRIPDYHRLDVSFTKDGRRSPDQRRYSNWSLSLYNVYARKNPYSIYFQRFRSTTRSYQLSVFGTIIPSISWNYTY